MLKIVSSTLRDTKYLDKIYIMYFFTLSLYMHIFFLLIRKIFSFYISKHLPCVRTYVQQYQLGKTSIYGFEWSWHLITKNLNQTIQTEMTSVHLHFNERNSNMSLILLLCLYITAVEAILCYYCNQSKNISCPGLDR